MKNVNTPPPHPVTKSLSVFFFLSWFSSFVALMCSSYPGCLVDRACWQSSKFAKLCGLCGHTQIGVEYCVYPELPPLKRKASEAWPSLRATHTNISLFFWSNALCPCLHDHALTERIHIHCHTYTHGHMVSRLACLCESYILLLSSFLFSFSRLNSLFTASMPYL